MLVSRLIPLLVLGGVGVHSGGSIKDRIGSVFGVGERVVTRQRIVSVIESARLQVASGESLSFRGDAAFRRFVRKNVRIRGNAKADPSVDMWGTPFKGALSARGLTVTSAGKDRVFTTKDDISDTQDIYNY